MKTKLTIALSGLLLWASNIQSQNLHWAYSMVNPVVTESFTDISSNGNNRFAVIGTGNAGISLDVINSNASYNSSGNFLAVYDENANIQWKADLTGNVRRIKMNSAGEVIVVGTDATDYISKYNASGNLVWNKTFNSYGLPQRILILNDGRIIVAGTHNGSSPITLYDNSTVSLSKGAVLLEFSSSGNLTAAFGIAVPASGSYIDIFDMETDASGNIYISGHLDGVADFDLGTGTSQNTATNGYDAFVVKYNSSYQLEWFKTFGDNNSAPKGWDNARSIKIDASNNIYVGGEFTWTTDFDPSNPSTHVLMSDNNTQTPSGYILKYNSTGNLSWVKKIGNTNTTSTTDYASVSVMDIELIGNNIVALLEGYGIVDMDPSSDTAYLVGGPAAYPGLFYGLYDLSGLYQASFQLATVANSGIITAVGFETLNNPGFVTAGKFQKKVDFDPSAANHFLQVDSTGTFYNFDYDLYLVKYSFNSTSGLESYKDYDKNLTIYPNPFQDILKINVPSNYYTVYDTQGRLLKKDRILNNSINLSDLNSGIYFLQIFDENNSIYSRKIIKH